MGIALIFLRGWPVLLFGLAGFLAGFLYTAPPIRLVHRGLGELIVGLGFDPIIVLGSYWVQAQRLSIEPLLASLPIGLLVSAILYINEVPDRLWDARAGKMTLVVRLKPDAVVRGYLLIMGAALIPASSLASHWAGWRPPR